VFGKCHPSETTSSRQEVEDFPVVGQREFEHYADAALEARLEIATSRLSEEFDGVYDRETIEAAVEESARSLSTHGVTPYVHILAERFTRERLRAHAQTEQRVDKTVPEVVFVSLTGGGRAQMGAAMLADRAGAAVSVHCAGSHAVAEIDDNVRTALGEIGIDLAEAFVRPVTSEVLGAADVVVTMGRSVGDVEIPGSARHEDWRVGDPAGAKIEEVRRVRDDLARRVAALADEFSSTNS
jgi:protein-tyrosine-phosphatase